MNTYHIVINDDMIRNIVQTDLQESMDLFSIKQVLYFLILGVFPSYFIYRINIKKRSFKKEIISKAIVILVSLFLIAASVFMFSKHYTSFFREHKALRYSINPSYWIYSIGKYLSSTVASKDIKLECIETDAKITTHIGEVDDHTELIIMVVGETARADHFSLNGYIRETNPLLKQEDIVNFSNMYSCGTSTAVSVPCMFSFFNKSDYSYKKGISTENVLDVLVHTNEIEVLWRDNNSNSKGVATRVTYEDFKTPKTNTICDNGECRDVGMLVGLDEYIKQRKGKDILIVLHQMGNHGPAYYKRYPKEFEKFTPACKTNQLEECTKEEISNAYDNAILYTDYFLSEVIKFLKTYDDSYATAMIYMSDHGESLGENSVYLHGLPYFMAPDAQIHIGSLMWFSDKIKEDINMDNIEFNKDKRYSQDNLFHTLLGLFEVDTKVYNNKMDIIYGDK